MTGLCGWGHGNQSGALRTQDHKPRGPTTERGVATPIVGRPPHVSRRTARCPGWMGQDNCRNNIMTVSRHIREGGEGHALNGRGGRRSRMSARASHAGPRDIQTTSFLETASLLPLWADEQNDVGDASRPKSDACCRTHRSSEPRDMSVSPTQKRTEPSGDVHVVKSGGESVRYIR